MSNKKKPVNIVYSTNPDYKFEYENTQEDDTLPPAQQKLRVLLDKKQRAGKMVTLVTGFTGKHQDLEDLGKKLKNKCGVGGTVKDQEIMIQGDFRKKIFEILIKEGFSVKIIN